MPPRALSPSSVRASLDSSSEEYMPEESLSSDRRLGIILDLDGTLVAESSSSEHPSASETFLRPAVLDFLRWCQARNHVVAVWTAAHASWAHYVTWKICSALDPQHDCQGLDCRNLFAFVWTADHMVTRARIPRHVHGEVSLCCWCESYRHACERCTCQNGAIFTCPCRETKDLAKVWKKHKKQSSSVFTRERTIIIENTPQQCVRNYGNAVYVPSYEGNADSETTAIFERLPELILQLEQTHDVRTVSRCLHGNGPHACFQQSWWRNMKTCRPVEETSSYVDL
ncbi:hypothetical protein FisN_2Hh212 [Fistulifera solaris]|jgi:hypothetical protein|uniref:Mitochondrial import inner membrane translocase subunit TIM50 n=1 Tax=Fistulifera solaris TaxID=1519565 RepID=A0A1Z5KJ99_FISSO|nr:hypothetical protein FisN_2Hh212 [Fistulifera solaris]|eukprot:GAX26370.1 hypothetical protein FisN_2Hh212 [Fistulifera solaris]